MSNDYQSGAAPSAQMSHAELIAEQLTNIESLGDGLPAVIAAGALRKLLRHLDEAHNREIDEIKKQVADLQQKLPKPDPNWRDICAKCFENGATEPPDCKYYTEDGCMSPIPDQHPLIQVGNAAKLREALELCMDEMCSRCRELAAARSNPLPCLQGCEPVRKAKAALAAPPRNCDRFGSSTQARAEWYKTEVLPRVEGVVSGTEPPFADWLFSPATEKEGGTNGNE